MTQAPNKPRRLPRFSLRSLILLVALAGSGYGLWAHWEPWARSTSIPHDGSHRNIQLLLHDRLLIEGQPKRLWDIPGNRLLFEATCSGIYPGPNRNTLAFSGRDSDPVRGRSPGTGESVSVEQGMVLVSVRDGRVIGCYDGNPQHYTSDGRYFVMSSKDRTNSLIDTRTGEVYRTFRPERSFRMLRVVANGKRVLTLDRSGLASSRALLNGEEHWRYRFDREPISEIHYSAQSDRVILRSSRRGGFLLDADTGRILQSFDAGTEETRVIDRRQWFSPDGQWIMSRVEERYDPYNKRIEVHQLHDAADGSLGREFVPPIVGDEVYWWSSFDNSNSGSYLLSISELEGHDREQIDIWDASTGRRVFEMSPDGPLTRLYGEYAEPWPDFDIHVPSRQIAVVAHFPSFRKLTVATLDGESPPRSRTFSKNELRNFVFLADGKHIMISTRNSAASRLLLIDSQTLETIQTVDDFLGTVSSMKAHGDRTVAQSTREGEVRISRRRRPEYWWGVAWLAEFWLTTVLGCILILSLRRDSRKLSP